MKKAVISGYYGFENFGDEISLQVIVNALKESGVNITVLSSNPELTSSENGVSSFYTFSIFDIIKQIFVSDVLISGGGSLLQDKTSAKSFIYYIFVIFVAKVLGKKVVIFSQGLTPMRYRLLERVLAFVLQNADYVSLRDLESQEYAQKLGINAKTYSDCVWALDKINIIKRDKLVVQLREWDKLTDEKLEILASVVANKYRNIPIEILSLHDEKDFLVCSKFHDLIKTKVMKVDLIYGLSPREIIETIASARCLIAMRYHACLVGIKQHLHILALSYDQKVTNLSKKFNLPYLYVDETIDLFEMELKKNIEKFEDFSPEIDTTRAEEQLAKRSLDNLVRKINNMEVTE
ncbi:MAG: polysaccharide pyruvyl transferase CsaB [Candidatus Gastranaerophilales bacterium]|nr:polysaccharide pyruvyl transferase CsaB [Candidatus Gastranaerophilales bacterium]